VTDLNLTPSRNYPKPAAEHTLSEDVSRIRESFSMLDTDVDSLLTEQNTLKQTQSGLQLGQNALRADVTELTMSQQASNLLLSDNQLDAQQGQQNKVLVSGGNNAGWQHQIGFNRIESGAFELMAGDRVLVTLSQAQVCTAPSMVNLLEPFYVANDRTSSADLSFRIPNDANYSIVPVSGDIHAVAGDEIAIPAGEAIALQCLKANTLEAI